MNCLLKSSASKLSTAKKHHFFIFGAPGVGKGTYAKLLADDMGFNHISTGD
jgi:adenylate kinase